MIASSTWGCGPGSITVGLADTARHVTGIDVDDAEFAEARAYPADHGIGNVEFLEGSIYELPYPDASADVCTLFSMMETLEDPLAGLTEVRRVVKPGGVVAASSIEYGGLIYCTAPTSICSVGSTSCGWRSGRRRGTYGPNAAGSCVG